MKRIFNKTVLAIALAMAMLFALVGGLLFARHTQSADALDNSTTVTFETETTSFFKNSSFKLKVTINTTYELDFSAATLYFGPLAEDETKFDTIKGALLTISNMVIGGEHSTQDLSVVNCKQVSPASESMGNFMLSISTRNSKYFKLKEKPIILTFDVKISESVEADEEFKIGLTNVDSNKLSYGSGKEAKTDTVNGMKGVDAADGLIKVTPLEFTVKEASKEKDLSELKIGQGESEDTYTSLDLSGDDEQSSFEGSIVLEDATDDIGIYLKKDADNEQTVTVQPSGATIEDGVITFLDVQDVMDADGKIEITVEAEDGSTKKYTVTVEIVGALLKSLIIKADPVGDSGVDVADIKFDSATDKYEIKYPNDALKLKITATVGGYNNTTTINLEVTGCISDGGLTAESGTAFNISSLTDNATLKMTVNATKDTKNTHKDYALTFKEADVDATIKTIEVKGQTSDKIFKNAESKAKEKGDNYYYYMIVGETKAASKVTVEANSQKAKVNIAGTDQNNYKGTKENVTEGEYTITITADAGNTKQYKFVLENYVPLQLKDDPSIKADFIFEEVSGAKRYRRSYEEKGMAHGIDDADFERIVIGQIADYTSISEFFDLFDEQTAKNIKLYSNSKTLLVDLNKAEQEVGQDIESGGSIMDDPDSYAISTSWYIEYWVDGELSETIYISVLGDLDSDGLITGSDIGDLSKNIRGEKQITDYALEVRLAGLIVNEGGSITGGFEEADVAALQGYLDERVDLTDYYAEVE